jgi:hypothetical protein
VSTERGTERARRACDVVNTHFAAVGTDAIHKWVALRLSDGGSDGVLYDRQDEAIRHQLHEFWCAYLLIPPSGVNPTDMETFLAYVGRLYDAGMRPMQNHDARPGLLLPGLITPMRREDLIR